jgi:CheY-like chemotaxis protein/PAS domain-containing protein
MQWEEWIKRLKGVPEEEPAEPCISKTLYYRLLDLSPDAILFYTKENGCIGANKRFLDFFGFDSLETFTQRYGTLQKLFIDEEEGIVSENDIVWLNYIKKVHSKGYGVRYIDAQQQVHHVLLHVTTLEHNNTTLYYITIKSSEGLYDLQAKLIASDSQKRELISKIGMQFRTPMQNIVGFVNLLQHSHLDETQEAYLKQVSLSAQGLIADMENLIDSQSLQTAVGKSALGGVYLDQEMKTLVASFEQKAFDKNLELAYSSDDTIPESVEGDIKKLKQLLFAMLSYAISIAQKGAIVSLNIKRAVADARLISFEITISNTVINPKRDELTLMHKLTELLEGRLTFSDNRNGAATLHATIPLSDASQGDLHVNSEQREHYRVMVVEDNRINQDLMRLLLEGYGIETVLASNGQEAIELAEDENFDMVFMDIDMPIVNGIEATRRIKQNRRDTTLFMPIVAVTALALEGDRERFLAAGLDDYLSKPLSRDMLELILKKYLNMGK